jgi:hypothetical protein
MGVLLRYWIDRTPPCSASVSAEEKTGMIGLGRKCPSDLSEALSIELQRLFFLTHPQHTLIDS